MNNAILKTVATTCILATFCTVGNCDRKARRVVRRNNGVYQVGQQNTRSGWLPTAKDWEVNRGVGTGPGTEGGSSDTSSDKGESLRPADVIGKSTPRKSRPQGTRTYSQTETTPVKLPKIIIEDGNEKKNFVLMASAKYCFYCPAAATIMNSAIGDEYISYKFELDNEKYKYLEDELKITAYPTFIIFKDGKEVERAIGVQLKSWFTKGLQKKVDQPDPAPLNIYDGL